MVAARFTTTTMSTFPIRRSHQQEVTIQQDLRLQIVRGESAAQAVRAALAESAGPGRSVDPVELVGLAVWAALGESAGQEELAEVLDLTLSAVRVLPTGFQDHLLGHIIHQRPGRMLASIRTSLSRPSQRQALFLTIRDSGTRTEIWRKTSPCEMGMRQRSQQIGWHLIDPRLRIAPTIRCEGLAMVLIRRADATGHSVAISPVEELKHRATEEGPASAEEDPAGEVVAAAAVVVEAAEEAEAVDEAEAAGDDVSWRFGPLPRVLRNRKVLEEQRTNRD